VRAAEPAGTAEPAGAGPAAAAGSAADHLALPIEELNLPLRAYNSLRREGVHSVGDLVARTPQQLLAIENIGPASVEEIRQRLAARGLALSEAAASANGAERPASAFPAPAAAEPAAEPAPTAAKPLLRTVPPPSAEQSWQAADDDAIDLLSVAGMPVLKRALPVAAGLLAAAIIALGLRRRRARR
jgi:hypothetical protein